MKKYIFLFFVFLSALSIFSVQEVFAEQIPIETYLQEASGKYDVFFTLEGSYPGDFYSEMLLAEKVSVQDFPGDIDSAIFALTNSITNLVVITDRTNKQIYHIIDKRLLGLNDYAMSQVLDSIKFDGNAHDFVNHITEKVPGLLNEDSSHLPIIILNAITSISIDDKNVSVRDALSNGIDLHGYNRLVWTSFTSLETRQTRVHFQGPRPPLEH